MAQPGIGGGLSIAVWSAGEGSPALRQWLDQVGADPRLEVRVVVRFVRDPHPQLILDVVDTGITLNYLLKVLSQRKPRSVRIVALLDKPSRRIQPVEVRSACQVDIWPEI